MQYINRIPPHVQQLCTLYQYHHLLALTSAPEPQNQNSLLEGLVFDRDRTRVSNIVQSSPLHRLATAPGGTPTPPIETQTRDCYRRIPRTKSEPRTADLLVTH